MEAEGDHCLSGRPVVIVGMHRSGTSIVTNALSKLGLYVGREADLVAANEFNQTGYWELEDIVNLNQRFLTSMSMAYYDLSPMPKFWKEYPAVDALLGEAENLFQEHFAGRDLWGWKEPVTTVLLPFYNEVFSRLDLNPHYVICVRNPFDVASSLAHRDKLPEDQTLGLWLRYTLGALKDSTGYSRNIVFYQDLLESPADTLAGVLQTVGGWEPDGRNWSMARTAVRKDLSHSRRSLDEMDGLPSIFRRTLQVCREASQDPEGLQSGKFELRISELWNELAYWMDVMGSPYPPSGKFVAFWQKATGQGKDERYFESDRKWQTVTLQVDAPPGSTVGAGFFSLPSCYWIRKSVWKARGKEFPASVYPTLYSQLEEVNGMRRLWAFHGPEQMMLQTPNVSGPYELEVEFLTESSEPLRLECIQRMAKELGPLRMRVAELEEFVSRVKPR